MTGKIYATALYSVDNENVERAWGTGASTHMDGPAKEEEEG